MTTGRINQITRSLGARGGVEAPRGADPTPGPCPRRGRKIGIRNRRTSAQLRRPAPSAPGEPPTAIHLPPLSPSAPVRTQGIPPAPLRARAGCGIRPSGGGTGPVDNADERRLPRAGSLQESGLQDLASGQGSTDSISAGGARAPGLRSTADQPGAAAGESPPRCCVQDRIDHQRQTRRGSRSNREVIQRWLHLYTYSPASLGFEDMVHQLRWPEVAHGDRL
jgi:hypothetical protein